MKGVLTLAAVIEAATGLALIIAPSLVGRLLFGAEFTGVANPAARVTGIALLALGVGCWPRSTAFCGMLTYSALVTLVASSGVTWDSDRASRLGMVAISKARAVRGTDEEIISRQTVTRTAERNHSRGKLP
jgi:hypothetical protein